ncbi:MAG: tRNA preQ1(34) S-adenosylmethionine ribosyltransferase-isomerase QueA [Treponema sp.]|nr:tRNA preQ1(34) S-adenosylmethionine ribosyltransferase-isomerase QueA [Treponema sp.]
MLTKDFYFDLPEELIAQHPSSVRGEDKLMVLERFSGSVSHHAMGELPDFIHSGTLMVFNNSRVRRARVYGIKETTGREQEFMFLNQLDEAGTFWNVMVKNAKKQKGGMRYMFPDGSIGTIVEDAKNAGTEFRSLRFECALDEAWFDKNGHMPLPPYIKRGDELSDAERYQTVYAKETGSAACPTAGLHFTDDMLQRLAAKGIDIAWVTLHVGLGTFLPVREAEIEKHKMHEEVYTIPAETASKVNEAKRSGRTILAVGTTSVRTLEAACTESGVVQEGTGSTRIFMYPGYTFKVVDEIFTNFHTPESTLLMLVSAFAGRENILRAYRAAVENSYRFFSYGDAMLITHAACSKMHGLF